MKGKYYMANTTNVTIRMDSELKTQAEKLFSDMGLNMSTAFNMFVRQAVRENGFPFTPTMNVPNAVTLAAMEDVEKGRNLHGPYSSVESLMETLNAED